MDLIIEDAVIVTMAANAGPAESMLVTDGRVAAVGSADRIRAMAGPGADAVRLDGATVIPGLIDAHCHVSDIGYLAARADCSQPSAPDIPAIQARLREETARTPAGSWVTGSGYVEYKLREGRRPTRTDLDAAVPDRPAVVYHASMHACALNSAALAEVGYSDRQPDPPGGALGRDERGRLDGVVFERPMFELFERNFRTDLTRMGAPGRTRLVESAGRHLAALGVTTAADADMRRDTLTAFAEAFGDRGDQLYAFRSWRQAGITVAGSSDAPVITGDALAMYTSQAAFVLHREDEIGTLEPGKAADFVVLDESPLTAGPERIGDIRVLATVLGGTPVFQAERGLIQ